MFYVVCFFFSSRRRHTRSSTVSWARNLQLSFWSIWLFVAILCYEKTKPAAHPMFHQWSPVIVFIVMLISAGGILVALAVKHADSIAKTITITGAVSVVAAFDTMFLGAVMTIEMMLGVVVTMIATLNYSFDASIDPEVHTSPTLAPLKHEQDLAPQSEPLVEVTSGTTTIRRFPEHKSEI
eukprot:TRINITY_DN29698_c0_g1_i1.p1 TRINITY_DN29698_c0_g1~~TRINITY_DN29698_c0_g1_i1.p1  ORF type:complete len:181 (+),score=6.82 TRINITY_DN29698_c0_g1_i1:89-631(+)